MHPSVALFSESAGRFLVSVGPGCERRFAELLSDLPAVRIGATSEEQTLQIGQDGQSLASLSVEEMSRIYRDPLYRLLGMERG